MSSRSRRYTPCWPNSYQGETLVHEEAHMLPKFFDQLNLQGNSRTVAAGGPCNWEDGDAWAEIKEVRVEQGSAVGSCGNASTTVHKGQDDEWWLDASSSIQFTRGPAKASAVAVVHKTDGTVKPPYLWPHDVQLH
jgi:hypothetical protein